MVFFNHIDYNHYTQLSIVPSETDYQKLEELDAKDFKDIEIVFVEADINDDIIEINRPLLVSKKLTAVETNLTIPVVQMVDENNIMTVCSLTDFLLVNQLTPEGFDINRIRFDLIIKPNQFNINENDGLKVTDADIDVDKVFDNMKNNLEIDDEPDE